MPLQPGFYNAEGDPWSYAVFPDGKIIVAEGDGNPRPVPKSDNPESAYAHIVAQIQSGQLKKSDDILSGVASGRTLTEHGNMQPIDKQPTPLQAAKRGDYADRLDEVTGEKMAKPEPKPEPGGGVEASKSIAKGLTAALPGTAIGSAAGKAFQAGEQIGKDVVRPAIDAAHGAAVEAGGALAGRVAGAPGRWADRAMSLLESVASDDEKGVLASLKARLYGRES